MSSKYTGVMGCGTSDELGLVRVRPSLGGSGHDGRSSMHIFHGMQVMIRVTNLETKHEWIWSRQKFLNRKFVMEEMYDNFQEGEEWDLPAVSVIPSRLSSSFFKALGKIDMFFSKMFPKGKPGMFHVKMVIFLWMEGLKL